MVKRTAGVDTRCEESIAGIVETLLKVNVAGSNVERGDIDCVVTVADAVLMGAVGGDKSGGQGQVNERSTERTGEHSSVKTGGTGGGLRLLCWWYRGKEGT